MNTATQLDTSESTEDKKPSLALVHVKPVKSGQECLTEIREQLNSKRRNPEHIFDQVLNQEQRKSLCFAAGLKRIDLTKRFAELDENARLEIKKAILMFGQIFNVFSERNALETKKFLQVGA